MTGEKSARLSPRRPNLALQKPEQATPPSKTSLGQQTRRPSGLTEHYAGASVRMQAWSPR